MAYAVYKDYTGDYGGSRLTEGEFGGYAAGASAYLELLTFGRCGQVTDTATVRAVTLACCAVADELMKQEREPPLTSQSVGQWSKSYSPQKSPQRSIADAARLYLRGTGLLWRGAEKAVNSGAG